VIEKRLVEKQAALLLVALRQRILQIPHSYARQARGVPFPAQCDTGIIAIRSAVGEGTPLTNVILMGADYYDDPAHQPC
jgi:hypothetical protein